MEQLKQRYAAAGQSQVFQWLGDLDDKQKKALEADLSTIEVDRLGSLFTTAMDADAKAHERQAAIAPVPEFASVVNVTPEVQSKMDKWSSTAFDAFSRNEVAVLLMAGGQGTRLGSPDPKGMYDIGLPSHKSLFQLMAERILRLQTLTQQRTGKSAVIPWYVMTSGPTDAKTRGFFTENNFFGLSRDNVMFFQQGTLPAFTMDGKIIMEAKDKVSRAPDGNGGVYKALKREGALADMQKRGVKYVHLFGVDNCLVRVADPVFVGYCIQAGADVGVNTVPKKNAEEKVGVVCLSDGKVQVVEYSEIDPALSAARNDAGDLKLNHANIANHWYTTDFLVRAADELEPKMPYHVARKKIKHVTAQGSVETPSTPNGVKLEMFVFDVFPFASKVAVMQVPRENEFSPVKNAPGNPVDSPDSARAHLSELCKRYITAAGGKVVEGDGQLCEVSPLVSYAGEGLADRVKGKTFTTPVLID